MTTAELILRLRNIISYDFDSVEGLAPDDASLVRLLNDSLSEIGKHLPVYVDSLSLNLDNSGGKRVISLSNRQICQREPVFLRGIRLGTRRARNFYGDFGFYTLSQLQNRRPDWLDVPEGVPEIVACRDDFTLVFFPPLSGAWLAQNIVSLEGDFLPLALAVAEPAREPELATSLHPRIPELAAARAVIHHATEGQQQMRASAMASQAISAVRAMARDRKARQMEANEQWNRGARGAGVRV